MIYTIQLKVRVDDEYAPYQRDEIADMMEILKGVLEWDIIKEEEE